MVLRIFGTDKEKERVVKLLQKENVSFDFPHPTNIKTEHLFGPSGKGKSRIERIDEDGNIILKSN